MIFAHSLPKQVYVEGCWKMGNQFHYVSDGESEESQDLACFTLHLVIFSTFFYVLVNRLKTYQNLLTQKYEL